jgi:FkbM family methyltransferase
LDPGAFLYGYREIFENEIYSFKPDKVPPKILDAGANIGLATIYWKRKFPNARITAFEPDPDAYQALVHNLKYNGYDDVNTIKKGLWKRNGSISFKFEGTTAGRIKKHSTEKGERVVSVTRLLDYLDEPIDMLKMDIEGAEAEVLLDSKKYLDRVKNLFVEYHSYPEKEQRIDEILSLLRQKDFRVHLKPGLCSKKPFLSVKKHKGLENTVNIFSYRK